MGDDPLFYYSTFLWVVTLAAWKTIDVVSEWAAKQSLETTRSVDRWHRFGRATTSRYISRALFGLTIPAAIFTTGHNVPNKIVNDIAFLEPELCLFWTCLAVLAAFIFLCWEELRALREYCQKFLDAIRDH